MNISDIQQEIIDFVSSHPDCQSSDMASHFNVDKTTISRNIKVLSAHNLIEVAGSGRSVSYRISESNRILLHVDIEQYFAAPYLERDAQETFNFEIFDTLQGDIFTEEEKEELEVLHKQFRTNFSRYDSQTLINKEYERIMIEFSWKSSAIEGNTYSLLNTEALIKENIKDPTKTDEESKMILNHKDSFNESIQNQNRFLNLNIADFEHVHMTLTKDIGITRNIRKQGVGISGTKYRPIDNEYQIKEALEKAVDLINQKESFFEKSFLTLALLSYIQAFEDGNKRTARMVSNAILLAHHSIPLSYRIVDVVEYKKASVIFYEINNISYLKKIFIEQFQDSVGNYFN